MSYRIRQGLSYCLCEDRPIFLDVELGRYSTLPTELCGPFAALMSNEGGVAPRDIERLLALHVIELGIHTSDSVIQLRAPSREVAPTRRRGWAIGAIVAQGLATHRVRHMDLPRLFAIEAGCRPIDRAADENDLGRLRGAFDQIATVFGEADECLPRSLAFRRLAFRCGHRPSLVIGVKIDPFGAHCWVQSGARLDNDSIERVRLFTPIYII